MIVILLMLPLRRDAWFLCGQVAVSKFCSGQSSNRDLVIIQDLGPGEGNALEAGDSIEIKYTGWQVENNAVGSVSDFYGDSESFNLPIHSRVCKLIAFHFVLVKCVLVRHVLVRHVLVRHLLVRHLLVRHFLVRHVLVRLLRVKCVLVRHVPVRHLLVGHLL